MPALALIAVLLLGERPTWLAAAGLLTGLFISAYTVNDGWAVKTLAIPPLIVDFTGNLMRVAVLTPFVLRDRPGIRNEVRAYAGPVAVVSLAFAR